MSVRRLHELLREQARDGKITAEEVAELIKETVREGSITEAERFTLTAALEAHKEAFTLDAWKALVSFLGEQST